MYPGYLNVLVDAAITVETSELSSETDGVSIRSRSDAIRFKAALSRTTTESALVVKRLRASNELYG